SPAGAPPSAAELETATRIRGQFLFDGDQQPYMIDIVRAMRLIGDKRRYVEIGTYDKGCLAYVSTLLAPDALLVDVDVDARAEVTAKLRGFIRPTQQLVTIVGDSTSREALARAREAGGPAGADC